MRFELTYGIEKRPGIDYKCNTGILGIEVFDALTPSQAKKVSDRIVKEHPVMQSAIAFQGQYPIAWLSESKDMEGRIFWSKLFIMYVDVIAYMNLVCIPPKDITSLLNGAQPAQINKEDILSPSQVSGYFIEI